MHTPLDGRRRWRAGALALWSGALACALAGCSWTQKVAGPEKKPQPDPILGEVHPQNTPAFGPAPPADKGKSAAPTSSSSAAPATDTFLTSSPTSTAYLASITPPLQGSRPLAINEPGPFRLASSDAPLVRPVPRDPAFINNTWATPSSGSFVAPPSSFVDPQTALLQSRGVTQHRVDPLPDGGIRLSAVVPLRGDASRQRTYEATARDFPAAVTAVVTQIDQGR